MGTFVWSSINPISQFTGILPELFLIRFESYRTCLFNVYSCIAFKRYFDQMNSRVFTIATMRVGLVFQSTADRISTCVENIIGRYNVCKMYTMRNMQVQVLHVPT